MPPPSEPSEPWGPIEPWDPIGVPEEEGLTELDFAALYDDATVAALDAWAVADVVSADDAGSLTSRLGAWSRSSTLGLVLTASALGLQEVLDPRDRETIVIEVDAAGDPHDLPVRLLLDPDDPAGSLCIVRRDPPPPVV